MENMMNNQLLNDMLGSDEYIIWKGQPAAGNVLNKSDAIMIPFSIFWCGFAIFWVLGMLASGAGFMAIFGIPFVAVGIYLVFGRFIHQAYRRKKTEYIITNNRIIVACGNDISSIERNSIRKIDITMHKNGCGTIYINDDADFRYTGYGNRRHRYVRQPFMLENIPEVGKVYKLLTSEI